MGRSQRDKGKRGEREIVRLLQAAGLPAERTAPMQASGAAERYGDVSVGHGDLAIEVKRRRRIAAKWERFADANDGDHYATALPGYMQEWLDGADAVAMRSDRGAWIWALVKERAQWRGADVVVLCRTPAAIAWMRERLAASWED